MIDPDQLRPPTTGISKLDEALSAVELSPPVAEHPERLAAAVEVLQQLLGTQQRG